MVYPVLHELTVTCLLIGFRGYSRRVLDLLGKSIPISSNTWYNEEYLLTFA